MLFSLEQDFRVKSDNKIQYGEVKTDYVLIGRILDLLPPSLFMDPNLCWLDPCCGSGYFMLALYRRLFSSLEKVIRDPIRREDHIITHMLWMIEINPEHIAGLYTLFGEKANIILDDFMSTSNMKFDVIIGNPPFTAGGRIKVPTDTQHSKKKDGKAVWPRFIRCALQNLVSEGYLAVIIPAIWMKYDHFMFDYMSQWNIRKLHTLSSTETNRIFHGQAQTPTSYFSLQKRKIDLPHFVELYDHILAHYVSYPLESGRSLPLYAPSIIKKLLPYTRIHGSPSVIKTSRRPNSRTLTARLAPEETHPHINISTCHLDGVNPILKINYSNIPCPHAGQPKLVLAHKMYGFPYHDISGTYGISNRDNYVIFGRNHTDREILKAFLSTKLALLVFKAARYRMQYLERYAFEFLPDITNIPFLRDAPTDSALADHFKLTPLERKMVIDLSRKNYGFAQPPKSI